MSVLVTGAAGQVGRECVARGALGLTRAELDLAQPAAIFAALEKLRPGAVVNAAAYTAVDKAETDAASAFLVNRDGAANLAQTCAQLGIPLIHFSTDYVFDGDKPGPYTEDDAASPVGVYARSKWEGEEALRRACSQHLVLRVSWVFGEHGGNFVKTILRLARERPELRVIADQRGCPTHAGAIAAAAMQLAQRAARGEKLPWGTYHYCGEPVTTWHGFAREIVDAAFELGLLERKPVIHAISTAEYPLPAKRPANSVLDMSRARTKLGLMASDWRADLRAVLRALPKN